MDSNRSREIILSKIKKSMEEGRSFSIPPHDTDTSVFPKPEDLLKTFIEELTAIGGNVIVRDSHAELLTEFKKVCDSKSLDAVFCIDSELQNKLSQISIEVNDDESLFKDMELAVTQCEYLVSRTGTVVVSSDQASGRRLNVFPPIHVVFAKASQLLAFPDDALVQLGERFGDDFPSLVSFITGASRTADIEKTLVMGAHGPKELFVFIDKNG
ncbi:hypothetical protein E9993_03385 [Labilibacter sediminis]|nr:hypothetical protein E9993_03385 [Labilibacter sediminis]